MGNQSHRRYRVCLRLICRRHNCLRRPHLLRPITVGRPSRCCVADSVPLRSAQCYRPSFRVHVGPNGGLGRV